MQSFRKNEVLSPTLIGHHIKKRFFEKNNRLSRLPRTVIDFQAIDYGRRLSKMLSTIDFHAPAQEKKPQENPEFVWLRAFFFVVVRRQTSFLHVWQLLGLFPASQGRKQINVTSSHIPGALRLLWRVFLPAVICLYIPSAKRCVERLNGKIRDVIIFRHKKAAHIGRPGVLMYIVRISGALFFNVVV